MARWSATVATQANIKIRKIGLVARASTKNAAAREPHFLGKYQLICHGGNRSGYLKSNRRFQ